MTEKPDTRIGATKESLDELKEKIGKIQAKLAPPGEEYTKIAQIFLLPVMRGDAETVLNLPEEKKDEILKKIGEAFCKSLMENSSDQWELDWLKQVAKDSMAGLFRGIISLDKETKAKVLAEQGRVCFLDHLKKMSPAWDKVGITYEPGTYHPDGAVALFASGLALRDVSRYKDTIFWIGNTRKHYERCCCPIYRTGVIDEQLPDYCECAVQFMKFQFEYLTGQPMEAELVETLNCGNADVCSLRVHMKPTWTYTRQEK
jgi:hypothetical protein